ncbi:hypothetical protein KI387_034010, partial [Taxus chinensis]
RRKTAGLKEQAREGEKKGGAEGGGQGGRWRRVGLHRAGASLQVGSGAETVGEGRLAPLWRRRERGTVGAAPPPPLLCCRLRRGGGGGTGFLEGDGAGPRRRVCAQ